MDICEWDLFCETTVYMYITVNGWLNIPWVSVLEKGPTLLLVAIILFDIGVRPCWSTLPMTWPSR